MKTEALWKPIGIGHHHGICVPLSAIHTESSCGIGEFLDLIALIDFCKLCQFDTIQLLPLNDQGTDTSPYNPLSSCALDPVYLSLSQLPNLGNLSKELASFQRFKQAKKVPILAIKKKKLSFLHSYYQAQRHELATMEEYLSFIERHADWLIPYAKYKSLKALYPVHWKEWPKEMAEPKELEFYFFLQYLCFSQMKQVRAYAKKNHCFLKGDVPFLVSGDSADNWSETRLFNQHLVAGAPPDFYNTQGQKWNFPIYAWDQIKQEDYAWWKRRLRVIEELYDLYRLDHVVGFFRVWAIEKEKPPIEGHFQPREKEYWLDHGREILSMMIDSCKALMMGEDLGTIPEGVRALLKEWGICGLKVIQWEMNSDDAFIPLDQYEPFSISSVSTHDSETLALWWKNSTRTAELFAKTKQWPYTPLLTCKQRLTLLHDIHHSSSYFHICLLQEYLALFPELVSSRLDDERINIPGTVNPKNWSYKVRPSMEQLLSHDALIKTMQQLLIRNSI